MSNEGHLDKRKVGLRIPLEICRGVAKKFALPSDKGQEAPAFIRALTEATKDVVLTPEDLEIIKVEMEANREKRMQQRKKAK